MKHLYQIRNQYDRGELLNELSIDEIIIDGRITSKRVFTPVLIPDTQRTT